ncbi:phytoene desaturase family protein [Nocardioides houyundeii]|uniref:phytoene desaturase family protein n=1 Tax=Nocardioides houyundeii TaxID=2045452 RepID=UPI0013B3C120|nr:NAD(P)/FAD-dependent oxidoreductase [Nocardioides houyundeii]
MTRRTAGIVGGGHNALVAAVTLARVGLDVTVLEQADEVGGCLWTQRHATGVLLERGAWEHGGVREVADALRLAEHGLEYVDHPLLAGFVFGDGERRLFWSDVDRTAAELGADGPAYRALVERAGSLFGMLDAFPAPPTLTEVAAALAGLRGGDDLFRSLLMPAETLLSATFEDPHLVTALGLYASHSQVPVWAPGSGMMALVLPSGHGHTSCRPVGGSGALPAALRAALEAAGGRVRTGALVTALAPAAAGGGTVTLASGEQLAFDVVVSSVDLPRTSALLGAAAPRMQRSSVGLHSGHFNICELTVSLVYSTPPHLPAMAVDPAAVWFAADRLEDLRRGFGEVVAGRLPSSPWSMVGQVAQPPDVAGGAVWLSSIVPLHRADGPWTPVAERAAADHVIDSVARILGVDLRAHLVDVVVSGPATWGERLAGDGNPNHLDNTIDQLLGWRPPGHADLTTELDWLHLTGAGQNPGGGLSGASGLAAAASVLSAGPGRRTGSVSRLSAEVRGLTRGLSVYRSMRKGTLR